MPKPTPYRLLHTLAALVVWAAVGLIAGVAVLVLLGVCRQLIGMPWWAEASVSLIVLACFVVMGPIALACRAYVNCHDTWKQARARQRGYPVCLHCEYDLRTCTGDVCPECGRPIERGRFGVPAGRKFDRHGP